MIATTSQIERIASIIWANLAGITHDGSEPWNGVGMRRYNGTSDARENVLALARVILGAAQDT